MSEMIKFFADRAKLIDRGLLGFNRRSLQHFNNLPERQLKAKTNASAQMRAERSDPFVYSRIISHINNGTTQIEDYSVEFIPNKIETIMSYPHKVDVLVPINRKMA